jgi:hypothetical protein
LNINFKVKNTFESKVPKCVVKMNFISFKSYCSLTVDIKTLSKFEKELCI